MAEEVIPLPASEHAGLLQQLKDSFSEGVQIQKDSDKKTEEKQRLISDNTKRAAQIAGRAFESTKGLLKGIDSIAETTLLGYSLAKKSFKLAERGAKLALRGASKVGGAAMSGLGAGAKKIGGAAKGLLDLLMDGAIMVGLFALVKLFESGTIEWLNTAKDFLFDLFDWFVLLFTNPMAALDKLWNVVTKGMSSFGQWIFDNTLKPVWEWFSKTFPGAADVMEKLFAGIATLAGNIGGWIYDNAIKPVWDWFSLLFTNPTEAINKLFTAATKLGEWVYNNAIKPLWDWFNTLFTNPMEAVNQYFKFMGNIGKFVYDEAIAPLWEWFGNTFPGAKEKLIEFWNTIFKDSSVGSYIYNTMLEPLWTWISTLFTNPTEGLNQLWTFFKTFDTWIYNTVLEPLWNWFSGLFPDVAIKLEAFWKELTGGGDSLLGQIGGYLTSAWNWFKGLFDFSTLETSIASALNFVFFVPNLIIGLLDSAWTYLKGLFGFKEDESKPKEPFSVGKLIVDLGKTIWGYVKSLFGFGAEAAEEAVPEVDDGELKKIGSKFSLTGLIGDMVDSIVDFFTNLFNFDVEQVFKDVFGALGDFGAKAYSFLFGDDDEDKSVKAKAEEERKEIESATKAMEKLAEGFQTATITAENIQLSDTAISAIAKALTTSEGGITPTVVNNYFDNSTVSQSTSGGVTNISTTLDSKNNQRQKINNN
tara:strand:+ start:2057 stop:4156 length:2100 start_codon:yes stop_codon:yes gene_type:complete